MNMKNQNIINEIEENAINDEIAEYEHETHRYNKFSQIYLDYIYSDEE
jgi:hypothetical protein